MHPSTAKKLYEDRKTLKAFKASAALAEAAEAAAGASADKPPTEGNRTSTAKGARVQTLSPNYKMASAWATAW